MLKQPEAPVNTVNTLPPELISIIRAICSLPYDLRQDLIQEILSVPESEICDCIQSIILKEYSENSGREANRIGKIMKIISGRENEWVPLDDFFEEFIETGNQAKNASNAIAELNKLLRKHQANFELRGTTHEGIRYYRFQRVLSFQVL